MSLLPLSVTEQQSSGPGMGVGRIDRWDSVTNANAASVWIRAQEPILLIREISDVAALG